MIAVPWRVTVAKPYSVAAGQTFTVTANVTYPGPSPLGGKNPVSSPTATIRSSSGEYAVVGSASQAVIGIGSTGSEGTASWTVRALNTRRTDDMSVEATGVAAGNTPAYGVYSDNIGGYGTSPPAPGPTTRAWGHDSVGVSQASKTWYLAEGCTNGGFETWVLVQNPSATSTAHVNLTYMTASGPVNGPVRDVPPSSRVTFNVADTVGAEYSVSTMVTSNTDVVSERAVYAYARTLGTDSIGAPEPRAQWYLAEGCTNGGFETWVLVQNPNGLPANVKLTYMTPAGKVNGPSVTVPANSRVTFNVADTVPDNWSVSTMVEASRSVIAERACYGNGRQWGHDSIGAPDASATWYLAEGCTNGGFETWVLVQNPNNTAASVNLTYMTGTGQVAGPTVSIPANSRRTFNVADTVPGNWSVSTKVTSSQPVIAERAMYGNSRRWGHDSIGVTAPATSWYLAEGCTNTGFESWVLVQNPNSQPANVSLTYMTPAGPVPGPSETLPANSRKTYNIADTVPYEWQVSTKVTANRPVVAERAMYGDSN
jgi:hypothetical protein